MAGLAFISILFSTLVAIVTAYSGDMTYNRYNGNVGACGKAINNGDMTVAVAPSFFTTANSNLDPVCGKVVTITYNGKTTTAKAEDKCAGCATADIDVTSALFTDLAGSTGPGRVNVQWSGI
ncbi:RlpA-like double-psi beta-barrel-protein domain-containing protein-containing protein [Apiospora phragmitis]|uniref:RlpA-like double-psi beta-barrel-protein domain-containing protein-containing protein n=1 Tax=Apiospora phragmitis TaxID=2905665 RepID=A0ABR1X7F2_9PEZI